jgi:sugar phosphate isomerase/epimerase
MQAGEPLFPIETQGDANDKIGRVLVIACGALAREILALRQRNGLDHLDLTCLPAQLHNTPEKIPDEVRRTISMNRDVYSEILVAYGDCGTGGLLDKVLEDTGARRIEGAHCYAFFSGIEAFAQLEEDQLGTFYLTDFLARHFQTMVIEPLGLDWHPHLRDIYFAHYTRVLYLAQTDDPELEEAARRAAERLELPFEMKRTGYGLLDPFLGEGQKA